MVEIAVPMLASKTVTQQTKHPARVLPRIGANIAQFLFNVAQPLIDLRLDGFQGRNASFNGWHLHGKIPAS